MKHCLTIILLLIASIAFANKPITKTPPRLAVIISIDGLDNYELESNLMNMKGYRLKQRTN